MPSNPAAPKKSAPLPGERPSWIVLIPAAWLTVFFLVPLVIILGCGFCQDNIYGSVELQFTLKQYQQAFDRVYLEVLVRSLIYTLLSTLLSLLIAFPMSYYIALSSEKKQLWLAFLVIIPFWTNLLIRLYSFIALLSDEGVINSLLLATRLFSEPLPLLHNAGSVIIGLLYLNLPFMILPLYAVLTKLDLAQVEAAMDLGASRSRAFWTVVVPHAMPGISAALVFSFIPTLGNFIVADLLGGGNNLMIGNLITSQFIHARNWPMGSALSGLVLAVSGLIMILTWRRLNEAGAAGR